ncbi:MAG: aryl-sulfate sulfotransferase [Bacteroidales bacterium]|nr:aryl-sulfate sulfotransferase [Bacteroidales bacterium]
MCTSIHAKVNTINGVAVPGDFPAISASLYGKTASGRIFFSSSFTDGFFGVYIVICENDGTPYFYRKYSRNSIGCENFKVQPNGLLSFYKNLHADDGFHVILDKNFVEIDTFRCVGNFRTDNHEFILLPNGHGLLICEYDTTIDMSQIIPNGKTSVKVTDNNIQEVDSDGHLYWEWNGWNHLNIEDSEEDIQQYSIDYIHLNSIAIDYDGHYIISLRNFSEVAKINSITGDFIWRLGGANNEFTFLKENIMISYQHHALPVPDKRNHYTIYDNGNNREPQFTRAVEYKIDPIAKTAEKVWEYQYPKMNYSCMMGSVQRLVNGNTYMDFSEWPPLYACEVDIDNNIVFEIEVQGVSGYRSFRFDWEGMMLKPYLLAESIENGVCLIFNKFGDPNVKEYQVYGGKTSDASDLLTSTSKTYAELTNLDNDSEYYFKVSAMDQNDQMSDFSDVVNIIVNPVIKPDAELIVNGDFSAGQANWGFWANSTAQATGSVNEGKYQVQISDGSTGYWEVMLIQAGFPVIFGRKYILEFDARADANRIIGPAVTKNSGNWADYSKISLISITTHMNHYRYEFEMTDPTDYDARLIFMCGASNVNCYFDNVTLTELAESDISSNENMHPNCFKLMQNFPNPFNPSTTIKYSLQESNNVTLRIYNLSGQEIETLVNEFQNEGEQKTTWHPKGLPSGTYLYKLEICEYSEKKKLMLLR